MLQSRFCARYLLTGVMLLLVGVTGCFKFSAEPPTGISPLEVHLENTSEPAFLRDPYKTNWDFGDDKTASARSTGAGSPITHTYSTPGVYTVEMSVTGGLINGSASKSIEVLSGIGAISLTVIPPIGSFANLQGQVTGIMPAEYRVAVYIRVGNWWTKPTFASPLTTINANGNWTCDITTGGIDDTATQVAAYLLPNGISPPECGGCADRPVIPEAVASICYDRESETVCQENGN